MTLVPINLFSLATKSSWLPALKKSKSPRGSRVPHSIIAFICRGFDEGPLIYAISQLRHAGMPVLIVGRSLKAVKGRQGIAIMPDAKLGSIVDAKNIMGLIFPGNYMTISGLVIDPRVANLIRVQLKKENPIVSLGASHAELNALFQMFLTSPANQLLMARESQPIDEFCSHLITTFQAEPFL